ncbi:unnamed protein product [Miscanthus lutarioriparius]|uniref:TFIIS N-terminal domain-containing protein n=1 Tax=Miscanthus lutarioriparius TaxID=422564 RepID=A0A811S3L5_9POAL|nr:unnamed protein product [Miscanthus lutarioriparius]
MASARGMAQLEEDGDADGAMVDGSNAPSPHPGPVHCRLHQVWRERVGFDFETRPHTQSDSIPPSHIFTPIHDSNLARLRSYAACPHPAAAMANEESGSPLRRWRPFYSAFGAIDEAIEAADHPRAAFREVRVRIVQLLRGAVDDGVAEQLCAALDDAMVEALQTLRVAPVPHGALASTDLARAVGALGKHGSARIRTLAGDVVRGWSTAIDGAKATAEEELDKLSDDRIPRQGISTAVKKPVDAQSEKMKAKKLIVTQSEKIEAKKPVAAQSEKMETKKLIVTQSEKMENTKRKLREGYEEAKKIKRLHTIQKIEDKEAPKLLEQSQRKMHRVPARCRISSGVRRSLLPSLQLI